MREFLLIGWGRMVPVHVCTYTCAQILYLVEHVGLRVRQFDPTDDFDFVWNTSIELGWQISAMVETKGFCVIQMFASSLDRSGMATRPIAHCSLFYFATLTM